MSTLHTKWKNVQKVENTLLSFRKKSNIPMSQSQHNSTEYITAAVKLIEHLLFIFGISIIFWQHDI